MNGPLIFLGLAFVMGLSWYGIVFKNFSDFGRMNPQKVETGVYPGGRPGFARVGQEVYQANGCASCHTMQVRMNGFGNDIKRGWGARNTVLQDFLRDDHVFLGQARIGPDLANVGTRVPDRNFHLLHLYDPRITSKGSMMPQYKYLFETRRVQGRRAPNALDFPAGYTEIEAGYEVVPTREAEALVEYLLTLQAEQPIFEAPIYPPPPPTNAVEEASTNSPDSANNQQ